VLASEPSLDVQSATAAAMAIRAIQQDKEMTEKEAFELYVNLLKVK
jgi:hypothetical protein